jgi:catechol 2,3-dioxygenase-like lactoylglutathione lyase family enzyme
MAVKRITSNIAATDITAAKLFYEDVLGLENLMDHGWIAVYGSEAVMNVVITIATQGGADTPVPDLTIEVDDIEPVLAGMQQAGFPIVYGPANEVWGVRRFYVRDPFGKLVSITAYI